MEPCPQSPCLLLLLQRSDMRERDVKRTCPSLYRLDGSCQNDSHTAVGGEHVIKKRAKVGEFQNIHIWWCSCLLFTDHLIHYPLWSGCAWVCQNVCSNIMDKEKANVPFHSISIYNITLMCRCYAKIQGLWRRSKHALPFIHLFIYPKCLDCQLCAGKCSRN